MATTIQISDEVKKTLDKAKVYERETYNEVITYLLEDSLELNKKTKMKIEESKKGKSISHAEVGRMIGL